MAKRTTYRYGYKRPPLWTRPLIVGILGVLVGFVIGFFSQPLLVNLLSRNSPSIAMPTQIGLSPTVVATTLLPPTQMPTESPLSPATQAAGVGRLEGVLSDLSGKAINNLSISTDNGPETKTDSDGRFVLNNVPTGDQLIVIKPPSGKGQLTQNIRIEPNQTTTANIVYDSASARLGLLVITAPVDDGQLATRQETVPEGNVYRATIYGRSDGLDKLLGNFEIWVLIKSERDTLYWVQRPPALVDPITNTWRATIVIGDVKFPPKEGEFWDIVAVAASTDSEMNRVINTPQLSLLPPHISSNIVTVVTQIKQ